MTTPCNRCLTDEHETICADCRTTFCGLCDEDDLNSCERNRDDICARCQPDHTTECDDCLRALALDLKIQSEIDLARGK